MLRFLRTREGKEGFQHTNMIFERANFGQNNFQQKFPSVFSRNSLKAILQFISANFILKSHTLYEIVVRNFQK